MRNVPVNRITVAIGMVMLVIALSTVAALGASKLRPGTCGGGDVYLVKTNPRQITTVTHEPRSDWLERKARAHQRKAEVTMAIAMAGRPDWAGAFYTAASLAIEVANPAPRTYRSTRTVWDRDVRYGRPLGGGGGRPLQFRPID